MITDRQTVTSNAHKWQPEVESFKWWYWHCWKGHMRFPNNDLFCRHAVSNCFVAIDKMYFPAWPTLSFQVTGGISGSISVHCLNYHVRLSCGELQCRTTVNIAATKRVYSTGSHAVPDFIGGGSMQPERPCACENQNVNSQHCFCGSCSLSQLTPWRTDRHCFDITIFVILKLLRKIHNNWRLAGAG